MRAYPEEPAVPYRCKDGSEQKGNCRNGQDRQKGNRCGDPDEL